MEIELLRVQHSEQVIKHSYFIVLADFYEGNLINNLPIKEISVRSVLMLVGGLVNNILNTKLLMNEYTNRSHCRL